MSLACSRRRMRADSSSRANTMRAASCCDITITTVQQTSAGQNPSGGVARKRCHRCIRTLLDTEDQPALVQLGTAQKWSEKAQQTTDEGSEGGGETFSGASSDRKTGPIQGTTSGCCCIKILIKTKKYGPQEKIQLISRRNSILIPAPALNSDLFPSCSQSVEGAVPLKLLTDWLRDSGSISPRGHVRIKGHQSQATSQLCTTKCALFCSVQVYGVHIQTPS